MKSIFEQNGGTYTQAGDYLMHTVDVHLAVCLSLVRILQIRLKTDIMKMDVCRHLIPHRGNDDG